MSLRRWSGAGMLLLALAGCASPQARFYSLESASAASGEPAQFGKRVMLGPVSLPAALDRPQLVLDDGGGRLRLQEFDRWSAPLDRLLAQSLTLAVSRRSGVASVYAYPQPTMDGGDLRYALDVRRLSLQPGRQAALEVVWQLQGVSDGKLLAAGSFSRSIPLAAPGVDAALAGLQSLLDALSGEMAQPLRQHPEWWQPPAGRS
ncbi:membrane integrity-associated transporter subunit PqiC [Chromobacterium subtsugae]|uniref:Membrane integrity-associated transporter subunit PqiC n=1 Tax=Chromobacterium subtsugae TaxID=251747 RepID=A0ABS7FD15_9NEIS|nr:MULTISPECIES: PqiC family protein [Chromobacterium]MBW7565641.1 membrane integrity-associated transporter subunit PqiC [Chromobacterium subtsugae]MBW8287972.1 membrane integrity-associated transporter subunit PqiC [Chromobacterium subtsugae]WSE89739.1 PqiC family protein [Chromobacterium subtsugae]WVH58110.1 PqiC family protein [Chromobacterium subtsugae]